MQHGLLASVISAVALLASPAGATWSIILVDVRTGEVAIASATCNAGRDMMPNVPVLVVGYGVAAAQSAVDTSGATRIYIRDQLRLGTDPGQILAGLRLLDPLHQNRQYGIVDVHGRAIGFSGTSTGAYAADRVGRVGDIAYAIQGNLLTGGAVLAAAELALYGTPGDVAEKLMAAMEAARSFGGDGRCSCSIPQPTSCGAPPPGFTKAAHIGFMVVARPGDVDGPCDGQVGCAAGTYYLRLNVPNQQETAPDPVLQLRTMFAAWKATERGRPDHFLSTVSMSTGTLPIDGTSRTFATVVLRDREGTRLTAGGALVRAVLDPSSTANPSVGTPTDHGDGTYSIPLIAGTRTGVARFHVVVDDGSGARRLGPTLEIRATDSSLWHDRDELPVATGGRVEFSLQAGPLHGANRPWILLASLSGTDPGIRLPSSQVLPLNRDGLLDATLLAAIGGTMPELVGTFPATGFATTSLAFPPGLYSLPAGRTLSFAYATYDPISFTSDPVDVRIVN